MYLVSIAHILSYIVSRYCVHHIIIITLYVGYKNIKIFVFFSLLTVKITRRIFVPAHSTMSIITLCYIYIYISTDEEAVNVYVPNYMRFAYIQ